MAFAFHQSAVRLVAIVTSLTDDTEMTEVVTMRSTVRVLLFSLPALTLTIGFIVSRADPETWFVGVPSLIWAAVWAVACWMLAVVNSLVLIKGTAWVLRPIGIVVTVCTVATGLAAFYFGSVALFCLLLVVALVASLEAVRISFSHDRPKRIFCRCYAACAWIGIIWSFLSAAPVTDTPLVQVMWLAATEWGNGFQWTGASFLAAGYLMSTWAVAFTVGWLASLCAGAS
jgi:hypothetical protein